MRDLPEDVELENRPCPNGCASFDSVVLEGEDRLHGLPGRFLVVRCRGCGLMRTNPRPTGATMGAYYPSDYGPYASSLAEPAPLAQIPGWRRRFRAWIGLTPQRVPDMRPGRMLEVGCASGAYLARMQREGWSVEGIEFSDTAAAQARSRGINVQTASIESAVPPSEPVDLVTAWMVLEHVHEPVLALTQIRNWIKPNGWLAASVPDAGSLVHAMFGELAYDLHLPNHLFHYTPKTLTAVLRRAGWQVERIWWQRNPNTFLQSLERFARLRKRARLLRFAEWLRTAPGAGRLRATLGLLLGLTRQSGRMEVWARPSASDPQQPR